ncbi:MAG: glycosyltransferase family 9 protein, partial [Candidatus Neomarinimicrobiota bacterium]
EIIKTGNYLNRQGFDMVIDLHNSLRSKLICQRMRRVEIRKLKKPRINRLRLFYFHVNKFEANFSYRLLLHQPIGDFVKDWSSLPDTSLHISRIEKESAKHRLDSLGIRSDSFGVIIPGAAWPLKQWTVQGYIDLISQLKIKSDMDFILIGGRNDTICNEIGNNDILHYVVDLHGKTELRESVAILQCAQFVVGSDTGLVHAAEAVGTPAIMIIGPTSIQTGAGTHLDRSVQVENNAIWCRPCSQNGSRACYRENQVCMDQIPAKTVFDSIKGAGLV